MEPPLATHLKEDVLLSVKMCRYKEEGGHKQAVYICHFLTESVLLSEKCVAINKREQRVEYTQAVYRKDISH